MQKANLNNFDPSARHAIREFETWQLKVFAKNAKKGGDSSNLTHSINLHRVQLKRRGMAYMKAKIE